MTKRNRWGGEELEKKIDWLIRLHLFSTDDDAGWRGAGTLGQIIDYKGDIPRGEGPADNDAKMINEVSLLGSHKLKAAKKHARYILNKLSAVQRKAVEYDIRFRNTPSEKPGTTWATNEEVARFAEMTLDQYESAKKRGRAKFKKEYLEVLQILKNDTENKKNFQNR